MSQQHPDHYHPEFQERMDTIADNLTLLAREVSTLTQAIKGNGGDGIARRLNDYDRRLAGLETFRDKQRGAWQLLVMMGIAFGAGASVMGILQFVQIGP